MKKQIKVAYFPSNTPKNKVLGSNGKSLDSYCIKCVTDEDSGNYIVDLTFLINDNIQDLLQEEVILKVLLDYGYEIFRISKVTIGTRYIDVVARQITIADSLTLWLEDVRPTGLNGQGAVSWLLDKSEGNKEIQIISDIDAVATAYYQRMSLYKALHDSDNSFIDRWGGEVLRRGYTVYINKRIGTDRGFSIREGKNLTGFECTSNIDNLVTRARGQGFNGILGNYIDSPLIGSYNSVYTGVIKYEDVKLKDENNDEGYDTLEQAQAELNRRINEEFSKNDIDKIKASYTINFVQLEKTEEYKNYIAAERLFTGDDSRVYISKLNVDIKVRAIAKKYDVLAQKTKEIKLSNYIETKPLSLKQITEKLESIDSTETILQIAKDNASLLIKGGLKNSYVIVRENEIIIGDTKDINTMTNVWRWNAGGLGHSKTGYYGEFGTAITQDGAIVADFITTGILNAELIKAGVLKSFNNKTWINMDNGTFNFGNKMIFDGTNFTISLNSGEKLEDTLSTLDKDLKSKEKTIWKSGIPPANPQPGELWLDTSKTPEILQRWSGSNWWRITPTQAGDVGAYTKEESNSQIKQLADSISSKVATGDFSTLIEQNAYSVRIAWNKISNYVQFENGGISIYNGSLNTSQKRAVFDERGNHFWRDGYYLGKIGTNQYQGDSSIKGIVFDLESQGGYMTWAIQKYAGDSTYDMRWTYANKTIGNYDSGRLHAGCDIDMHNYYLRNVNFEGGGISGTLNFTQVKAVNSNGTLQTWSNNCKLVFQNGILIDGTWSNT